MNRLYIVLSEEERSALQILSDQERRDPRRQAALLVRQGLEQAGLLPSSSGVASYDQPINTVKGAPDGSAMSHDV